MRLSIVGVSSFLVSLTFVFVTTCAFASWQGKPEGGETVLSELPQGQRQADVSPACAYAAPAYTDTGIHDSGDNLDGLPYDVSIIEATGVPVGMAVPWLVLPDEPFLPGVLVAGISLVRKLEAAGVRVHVLRKYVEYGQYYLVRGAPLVSETTLSRLGDVVWSRGDTHLVHSEEDLQAEAGVLGLEVGRLRPLERSLASLTPARAPISQTYSPEEKYWIGQMVNAVSEDDVLDYLNSLTGEKPVNLACGPDTILTRYSYSPGCRKTAEYLYQQFDSMGLDVAYQYYFGADIHAVTCMGLEGYAAGSRGTIYHTEDGGASWLRQNSGTTADLLDLLGASFIAPDTGWVSGECGLVLRTVDGGLTWDQLQTGVQAHLYDVSFASALTGWVCGSDCTVLNTKDGGLTWSSQESGTVQGLYRLEFVDARNGWAVGEGGEIVHTADGGEHWLHQASGTDSRLYDVCFVDSLNGWAVGWDGTIVRTADGGSTWESLTLSITNYLRGVCFVDRLRGWIVGSKGLVLSTKDGGLSWSFQQSGADYDLYTVSFDDRFDGWAGGNCSLIGTKNGGDHWDSLTGNTPGIFPNVIGTIEGTSESSGYYILCGHFDSYSTEPMVRAPGADDNASGTSVVLEAASVLKDFPFLASIKFICFSGEEQWMRGSEHYAREAHYAGDDIAAVLNFDMVGYGTPPLLVHDNVELEPQWLVGYCMAVRDSFVGWLDLQSSVSFRVSDEWPFVRSGYSAIAVTETALRLNPNYHKTSDTVGTLTIPMITDATRLAVASAASLAGLDTSRVSPPPESPQVPEIALAPNYPNPFGPSTRVLFSVPATTVATKYILAVFDLGGATVRILEEGQTGATALQREVTWDGRDGGGKHVASGVYLCSLRCGGESRARKIVLIR